MFDSNLLFYNATAVTADGNGTDLDIQKTTVDGVWVEVICTAVSGTSPTCDLKVQESDDDSTYNDVVTFPQITTTGRWVRKVQSKKRYLRMAADVGGTSPSFTLTAGIVTGIQRDHGA